MQQLWRPVRRLFLKNRKQSYHLSFPLCWCSACLPSCTIGIVVLQGPSVMKFPGKNTGSCHSSPRIFLNQRDWTQGLLCLLHCKQILPAEYDSAIHPGHIQRNHKSKRYIHQFSLQKHWWEEMSQQTYLSINSWMDKEEVAIHMQGNNAICKSNDDEPETISLSEVSQTKRTII